MKIKEVLAFMEQKCPLSWQEDFDNCGVQCGDRQKELSGIEVCFNFSEEVLNDAIEKKNNLIISHHPLIFAGLKKIEPTNEIGRMVIKAIENGLTLYSMHTNMDSAVWGGNWLFAEKLQLSDCKVLEPHDGEPEVGLGRIGKLPKEMELAEFIAFVKEKLQVEHLRYTGNPDLKIARVALCGGAGGSLLKTALRAGADAYLTGDLKYHDFFSADKKMLIADLGHFETEHFIKDIIFDLLKKQFADVPLSLYEGETSGIQFV